MAYSTGKSQKTHQSIKQKHSAPSQGMAEFHAAYYGAIIIIANHKIFTQWPARHNNDGPLTLMADREIGRTKTNLPFLM